MNSNKYVLKSIASGLFYVEGNGFSTSNIADATRLSADEAGCTLKCAAKMGIAANQQEIPNVSFAVVYVRQADVFKDGQLLKQAPKTALNQFDPSKRRFATRAEANTHGKRFDTRRARRADAIGSGTANHIGFFVVETNDAVNSRVNPETGLTNSL